MTGENADRGRVKETERGGRAFPILRRKKGPDKVLGSVFEKKPCTVVKSQSTSASIKEVEGRNGSVGHIKHKEDIGKGGSTKSRWKTNNSPRQPRVGGNRLASPVPVVGESTSCTKKKTITQVEGVLCSAPDNPR